MSRCFPFPPPGYENKARLDDVKLIIKEKHKEKKHKKDKDKKEKNKRKEEKSEDKHGEKKDRKRKEHKDKKDKKKHKDKHRTPEEKKIVGSLQHQNGEKLGPVGEWSNTIPDSKVLVELRTRAENDQGATNTKMVQGIIHTDQKSAKLARKVENDGANAMGLENGFITNFSRENGQNVEGGAEQVEKVEKGKEGREKIKHKNIDGKKDGHKDRERDKKSKSKDKMGGKEKEKEKVKVKVRSRDESKQRASNGNSFGALNIPSNLLNERQGIQGNLGKRKEPELNGFPCDNVVLLNKLPKPGSSHEIMQNGNSKVRSQNTVYLTQEKVGAFQNHTVNSKNLSSQSFGTSRRFDHGPTANHFPNEHRASSCNYMVSDSVDSSQPVLAIRKKMEPCQTESQVEKLRLGSRNNHKADDKVGPITLIAESGRATKTNQLNFQKTVVSQDTVINHKMEKRDSQVNGLIDPKQCASSSVPSASLKAKKTAIKPPHPDSKYLSQILAVPDVDWPGFDDQEWLFGSKDSGGKRPKFASAHIEGTEQVWAEAIQVESADVIALPYVIPY